MERTQTKKETNDFILLIMNCVKYTSKRTYQRNTWLKTIPSFIKYYHVIGNPTLQQNYLFDNINNILFVKTQDDYCSLPSKVIESYEAIFQTFNFKYIFKTDDDQSLLDNTFFDTLSNILLKTNDFHYGGNILSIRSAHYSLYNRVHNELPNNILIKPTKYCNGRFYFLSNQAIFHLIKIKNEIKKECIEDYAVGFNLDIKFKDFMFFINTDKYFKDIPNNFMI
jgi:hypothetical protein